MPRQQHFTALSQPPYLPFFLTPLLWCFLNFKGHDRDVPFRADDSIVTYSQHFEKLQGLSLAVTYCKEKLSWLRLRIDLICKCKQKYLVNDLAPFSVLQNYSKYPLGAMVSPVMSVWPNIYCIKQKFPPMEQASDPVITLLATCNSHTSGCSCLMVGSITHKVPDWVKHWRLFLLIQPI